MILFTIPWKVGDGNIYICSTDEDNVFEIKSDENNIIHRSQILIFKAGNALVNLEVNQKSLYEQFELSDGDILQTIDENDFIVLSEHI